MKNIIVVGDSFCSATTAWPGQLADLLKVELICQGLPGASWWPVRQFLMNIDQQTIDNTEAIIFCHTDTTRLLNTKLHQGKFPRHDLDTNNEEQLAVKLYYKHVFDEKFAHWAEQMWFSEISTNFGNLKLIHLHCFPWSFKSMHLLNGSNIQPNLTALSLNEIGADEFVLIGDTRHNHLNEFNNTELARQLSEIIKNYSGNNIELDIDKFQLKTKKWFDWGV